MTMTYLRSRVYKRESLETLEAEFPNSQELSIGLWVGQSLTPNTNKDAVSKKRNLNLEIILFKFYLVRGVN